VVPLTVPRGGADPASLHPGGGVDPGERGCDRQPGLSRTYDEPASQAHQAADAAAARIASASDREPREGREPQVRPKPSDPARQSPDDPPGQDAEPNVQWWPQAVRPAAAGPAARSAQPRGRVQVGRWSSRSTKWRR
jgi:hypothetical protein